MGGPVPTVGPTRVVIVDDHLSVAEALAVALDQQADIEAVGCAGSVADGIELVRQQRPDVVLMDALLPGEDGVEGARRILRVDPGIAIVMLTGYPEPELLARAARAGVAGFLSKQAGFASVADAVRSARGGAMLVPPETLGALLEQARTPSPTHPRALTSPLTEREREVLLLLAEGTDLRSIAGILGITIETCRGHVKNLLMKLDAHSQLQAVVVAARLGLLPRGHALGRRHEGPEGPEDPEDPEGGAGIPGR